MTADIGYVACWQGANKEKVLLFHYSLPGLRRRLGKDVGFGVRKVRDQFCGGVSKVSL